MQRQIILLFVLAIVSYQLSCPTSYNGDYLQSSRKTFVNAGSKQTQFKYTIPVFFKGVQPNPDIMATISSFDGFNSDTKNGLTLSVSGRKKVGILIQVNLKIDNGNSWKKIQVSFLVASRNDLTVGNLQFNAKKTKLADGKNDVVLVSKIPKNLENQLTYVSNVFLSGIEVGKGKFDYKIKKSQFTDKRELKIWLWTNAKDQLWQIQFGYIIYADPHPYLKFSFHQPPNGEGSYPISGPVQIKKDSSFVYSQWYLQNRFLYYTCPGCDEQTCIRSQECIQSAGLIYKNRCQTCPKGTKFEGGYCLCPQNDEVFDTNSRKCVKCFENSTPNLIDTQCICKEGYKQIGDRCQFDELTNNFINIYKNQCPQRSTLNKRKFICECNEPNEHLIDGQCKPCGENQAWNFGQEKCVCVSDHYRIDGVCRTCDPRSKYNGQDCVCNAGFFGNRDKCQRCHESCSKCTGPNANQCTLCANINLTLKDGFCTELTPCPIGRFLRGSECAQCSPYCNKCQSQQKCSTCAPGFQLQEIHEFGLAICSEICGDGRRFEHPCDDGNTKNGDGCSNECQIEQGWTCTSGTSIKKSECVKDIPSKVDFETKASVNLGSRVIQAVRSQYLPDCITQNDCANCYKAIKVRVIEALVPVQVTINYVPASNYQFFIEYDFLGLFVTSALKVVITLNDQFTCLSQQDLYKSFEMVIDPGLLACDYEAPTLTLGDLTGDAPSQSGSNSCQNAARRFKAQFADFGGK